MSSVSLPPRFVERMRVLLGDEAGAFFASYEAPPRAGLRVNALKLEPEAFRARSPWALKPVPWCPTGFLIADDARPGRHPYHAAGLYYLQEPSAMAVAEALDIRPGQLVLDLAASPGGKATHIAALLRGEGTLVANEVVPSRIKPLGENLERLGATNVVLTNEEPARLADRLGPAFDRVLLDAPCSGEGMFRKSLVAIREWSPEHVSGSAARQAKILEAAARLVRPGGLLLYSTCTFAPEENERQIAGFLARHPGWELAEIPRSPGFTPARPDWSDGGGQEIERAVRLWPHRLPGEGHFLALLRNNNDSLEREKPPLSTSRASRRLGSATNDQTAAAAAWERFVREALAPVSPWLAEARPERLLARREQLFLQPPGAPGLDGLTVVRPGLPLGAAKPGRFEPAHALALALRSEDARNVVDLDVDRAERYLAGEPLTIPGPPGWTLVTVGGWPLGWGRRSGDVVKNHYPKGLRRR